MFSQALEIVLTIAHREATSRRHAHLTLEHLVYALAHDPDGEAILAACGADLPKLRQSLNEAGVPNLWIPKSVLRVESIPVLASGKLNLLRCKELAAEQSE